MGARIVSLQESKHGGAWNDRKYSLKSVGSRKINVQNILLLHLGYSNSKVGRKKNS